jgi:hypothetical protein
MKPVRNAWAKSVETCNHFWSDADTWCFEMEVFHDPVSAGKQMGQRWLGFFYESPARWRNICAKATRDPPVHSRFLENTTDCVSFLGGLLIYVGSFFPDDYIPRKHDKLVEERSVSSKWDYSTGTEQREILARLPLNGCIHR